VGCVLEFQFLFLFLIFLCEECVFYGNGCVGTVQFIFMPSWYGIVCVNVCVVIIHGVECRILEIKEYIIHLFILLMWAININSSPLFVCLPFGVICHISIWFCIFPYEFPVFSMLCALLRIYVILHVLWNNRSV
jgi:hypothetical protein